MAVYSPHINFKAVSSVRAVARSGRLLLLSCWRRSPSPFWPGGRGVGAEPGTLGVEWINVCMLCKIRRQHLGFLRFAYSLQLLNTQADRVDSLPSLVLLVPTSQA